MSSPLLSLIVLTFLRCCCSVTAATLDIRFHPESGRSDDVMYPGISTASVGSSNGTGILATLTGRGYGVEQSGKDRWGIAAGPLSWNGNRQGWTVRNGFAPDRLGATVSGSGTGQVEASYLSIKLSGVTEGTLFKNIALTFSGVTYLRPANAWAGTSADAFSKATAVSFTAVQDTQQLAVNLPDFTWKGGDPLEIRIYGVIGSDEGAFQTLSLAGESIDPATVPEANVEMLITAVLLGATVAFRRRGNAVSH